MFFDPLYFLFLAPALLLAAWASYRVKSTMAAASEMVPSSRLSGAEAAQRILAAHRLDNVRIEQANGFLGDHYDPRAKVLRLTPPVYSGRSLAAVGVAAHEAGHALQDAHGYAPLKLRAGLLPMASFGGNFSMMIFIAGMFLSLKPLIIAGVALFSCMVLFQLINLPVEFNASSRARELLVESGIVGRTELAPIGQVLNAAALTYVAATMSAILTLVYLLFRSGLLGGNRR
ncbi:MAG: zinc metallopeptidase [Phycisphaerales bacterium]|nr:zinc metallopeptidase [Phycisphaerales bacterium]